MQNLQNRKYLVKLNAPHSGPYDYADKPQYYVFETLKLDAGSHTWLEELRLKEERTLFYGRTVVITESDGSGRPHLNTHTDHTKVGG